MYWLVYLRRGLLGASRRDLKAGNDSVQTVARHFAAVAATKGVPVVLQDLDFRREKAWLRKLGKRFGTVLSQVRTRQLLTALERLCRRRGVKVIYVDQAWSTKLAQANRYPNRYRIRTHHAAALVIGRRGLRLAEHVPQTATPPVRAEVKRRGTCGWTGTLTQWLPGARRRSGRRGTTSRSGAREGPVGTPAFRPDGPAGAVASRDAVAPAKTACVLTVA